MKASKKVIIVDEWPLNVERLPFVLEPKNLQLHLGKFTSTIRMNCLVCLDEYIQKDNDIGLIIIMTNSLGLICNKHHASFYEKHSFDNRLLNDIQFYQETIKNGLPYQNIPILFISSAPIEIIPKSFLDNKSPLLRNIDAYLEMADLHSSEILVQIWKMLGI